MVMVLSNSKRFARNLGLVHWTFLSNFDSNFSPFSRPYPAIEPFGMRAYQAEYCTEHQ